ncbi:MAG: hypothetical protein EOP51_30760 [Sphingobacteriales bacterium]|nr:MAG: hypothetical protein EOP51_30760 [Sphingobacteriales bacterium]
MLTASNGICIAKDSITIGVNQVPVAGVSAPQSTICAGTPITLNATSSIAGVGYTWFVGQNMTGDFTASPTFTPNVTTTYVVKVNNNDCIDTASVTVNVNPVPQVTTTTTPVCAGATATLVGTPTTSITGTTYNWSNSAAPNLGNQLTLDVTPSATTIYTLTATAGICQSSSTVELVVNQYPQFSAGPDRQICAGQATILLSTDTDPISGVTYTWSPATGLSATDILNPYAGPLGDVTYYGVATANGCSTYDTVNVITKPAAVVNAGPDVILCPGVASVTLTGTETSGLSGITYEWFPEGGATVSTDLVTQVSPSVIARHCR